MTKRLLTRRTLIGGAAGAAAVALLAACGADPTATARPAAAGGGASAAPASSSGGTAVPAVSAAPSAASTAPSTAPSAAASAGASAAGAGATPTVKPTPVPVATGVSGLAEATAQATGAVQAPNLTGKISLKKVNFAFVPAEDAGKTLSDNKDLLAYMRQALGVDVIGAVGTSYTAVIEAMRNDKVDIAYHGPFSYILAAAETKAEVIVQGETAEGKLATYNSLIIVPADSPSTKLEDLKGKTFAFVDPASASGHLVPNYTIQTKAGLKANVDYKAIFAGTHPGAYQSVANKKTDGGAIASDIFDSGVKAGTIDPKAVKIIDKSFDIPGSPIAYRGNLSPADKDVILELFLSINNVPKESSVWKTATAGLGVGTVKIRKGDDSTYNDFRKIPGVIGINIKDLVK